MKTKWRVPRLAIVALAMSNCIFGSLGEVSGAVIQGSLFDPDDYAPLNGGADVIVNSGQSFTIDTSAATPTITAPFGTGNGVVELTEHGEDVAVFTFSTLSVLSGANVTITGSRPFVFLAVNDLTFNAVTDISGAVGEIGIGGAAGVGGFAGGGGALADPGSDGFGPGGGGGGVLATGGGGAGKANLGDAGSGIGAGTGGATYGDNLITDITGGSGGGAGGGAVGALGAPDVAGSGGGGGGGSGVFIAQGLLSFGGTITANGGNGGASVGAGGGGAGSGGSLLFAAPQVSLSGTINSIGGAGGNGGVANSDGGDASDGRIAVYYDSAFTTAGSNINVGTGTNYDNGGINFPAALSVPEPSTTLLLLLGGLGAGLRRRR